MRMSDSIRIGIVGSKFAAAFHMACYARLGNAVEIAGVFSETPTHCNTFADRHGIQAFSTFAELADKVDVIDICAPGYVHEFYAVEAARAGKHLEHTGVFHRWA